MWRYTVLYFIRVSCNHKSLSVTHPSPCISSCPGLAVKGWWWAAFGWPAAGGQSAADVETTGSPARPGWRPSLAWSAWRPVGPATGFCSPQYRPADWTRAPSFRSAGAWPDLPGGRREAAAPPSYQETGTSSGGNFPTACYEVQPYLIENQLYLPCQYEQKYI